jgi:hypothetical protein
MPGFGQIVYCKWASGPAEEILRDLEHIGIEKIASNMVDAFRGRVAALYAHLYSSRGEAQKSLAYVFEALALLPEDDLEWRTSVRAAMGGAYTSLLTPFSLVAALIIEGLPLLFITGIIAWLIPADEDARNAPRFTQVMRESSFFSWIWRIVIAGVPYTAIYLFFAMLVTPLEHAYYYDSAFIASLHTVVPSTTTTLVLEAVRGILFVLAMLPIIAVMRKSRWSTGLYIALVGAVLEAWIPLLGQTSWPMMMRVGNVLELTGDACGRALLMALLVVLPSLQASRSARQQLAADV